MQVLPPPAREACGMRLDDGMRVLRRCAAGPASVHAVGARSRARSRPLLAREKALAAVTRGARAIGPGQEMARSDFNWGADDWELFGPGKLKLYERGGMLYGSVR
jgi:hypothetical protein